MFWILGINARNLLYIKKFNPRKAIRLADDKLKTKRFMEQRGIPVPWTYDVIRTSQQLRDYDFGALPVDEWIVKPTKWSRWRWIYRVKRLDKPVEKTIWSLGFLNNIFGIKKESKFPYQYKVSGEIISDTTLKRMLSDILRWVSSLMGSYDTMILEELILPGEGFKKYCEHGLADIRVIVFNLIPVATMLRVPTLDSDGKANLSQWAVGMWVEVWTWEVISLSQWGKAWSTKFPEPYTDFENQIVPYRDEILEYSSKIQFLVNLWYLALDRVITDDGPKLLEINARAWLWFQNASLLPLKKRLDRIGDVTVTTPQKWVEIAKSLFGRHKSSLVTPSKVLYLSQYATFKTQEERLECIVHVDLSMTQNYLSPDLWDSISGGKWGELKLQHGPVFEDIHWKKSKDAQQATVILWKYAVSSYYIKPLSKVDTKTDFINSKNLIRAELDQLHILDQQVEKLWRRVNTSKILKPTNFLEELDIFVTLNGNYNPKFIYHRPSDERLDMTYRTAHKLLKQYFWSSSLQSWFARLFKEKIEEIIIKNNLIKAYKSQDFQLIQQKNLELFGEFDEWLVALSKEKMLDASVFDRSQLWPMLSKKRMRVLIRKYLRDRWFNTVQIIFTPEISSRISVIRSNPLKVQIADDAVFRETELLGTLAHEVDVHIQRYINGLDTGWKILKNWTAWYISDEEWMAIHASSKHWPDGYEKTGMYERYFYTYHAWWKSFKEFVNLLRQTRHNESNYKLFKLALRVFKWVENTALIDHTLLFSKDKVYLEGYTMIMSEESERVEEAMKLWKVKIDDIQYIK